MLISHQSSCWFTVLKHEASPESAGGGWVLPLGSGPQLSGVLWPGIPCSCTPPARGVALASPPVPGSPKVTIVRETYLS